MILTNYKRYRSYIFDIRYNTDVSFNDLHSLASLPRLDHRRKSHLISFKYRLSLSNEFQQLHDRETRLQEKYIFLILNKPITKYDRSPYVI